MPWRCYKNRSAEPVRTAEQNYKSRSLEEEILLLYIFLQCGTNLIIVLLLYMGLFQHARSMQMKFSFHSMKYQHNYINTTFDRCFAVRPPFTQTPSLLIWSYFSCVLHHLIRSWSVNVLQEMVMISKALTCPSCSTVVLFVYERSSVMKRNYKSQRMGKEKKLWRIWGDKGFLTRAID